MAFYAYSRPCLDAETRGYLRIPRVFLAIPSREVCRHLCKVRRARLYTYDLVNYVRNRSLIKTITYSMIMFYYLKMVEKDTVMICIVGLQESF